MVTDQTGFTETEIGESYGAYDCRVNALDPAELFRRYERIGFIYPAKAERLRPFLPLITENWRKALRGGELIHYVATCGQADGPHWATVSSWRSTNRGWISQHLASTGNPLISRDVMLAVTAVRIRDAFDRSHQNWFRPINKYAQRIFGTIVRSLGEDFSSVNTVAYIALPRSAPYVSPANVHVREARPDDRPAVQELAETVRGTVYAAAEELDSDDLSLQGVNELYRMVGLSRHRRVLIASEKGKSTLSAAALVYRGPLGMNFSFLENRCDLLVSDKVSDRHLPGVVSEILLAVAHAYDDFLPGFIPIATDQRTAMLLLGMGGQILARYSCSIWLRERYVEWYRHVARVYERIERRRPTRGSASSNFSGLSAERGVSSAG